MSEKKQNLLEKTTTGKKEDHSNMVAKTGTDQDSKFKFGDTPSLNQLLKQIAPDEAGKQGYVTIHNHYGTCNFNYSNTIIRVPKSNTMLEFLIKIAPLMVKDSSITAPEFIIAVIKEVPNMVKDSSITAPELYDVMVEVKNRLVSGN